jgi:hypothetical protein
LPARRFQPDKQGMIAGKDAGQAAQRKAKG